MISLGELHLAAAIASLVVGAVVLLMRKGNRLHRRIGWTYAISMLVVNVTALMIYRLTGVFGPFHVAALISLATLVAGVMPARRRPRKPNWIESHYYFMTWSYVGLVAAALAETATRASAIQVIAGGPTPAFWIAVAVASAAVFFFGSRMIRSRAEATMRPFRKRSGGTESYTSAEIAETSRS